jgi:hypothetical protein
VISFCETRKEALKGASGEVKMVNGRSIQKVTGAVSGLQKLHSGVLSRKTFVFESPFWFAFQGSKRLRGAGKNLSSPDVSPFAPDSTLRFQSASTDVKSVTYLHENQILTVAWTVTDQRL